MQEGLNRLTQTVMELEAAEQTGAGRYPGRTPGRCERTPERRTYRNGHRERVGETRVGEIPLRVPKVRDGTCFPSLLEPRRRSEKALLAVIQLAYVGGVSTRRVEDLLQALGLTGIDTHALAGRSGAGDCYRGAGERGAGDAGLRFGSQRGGGLLARLPAA